MRGAKPFGTVADLSPVTDVPEPPDWLAMDARTEWKRIAPILITQRQSLTNADLGSLTNYCTAMGQIAECSRIIAKEGIIVHTKTGPKKHPAVAMRSDATTQARLLAAELGLTPVSRARGGGRIETPGMRAGDGLFDPALWNEQ